jgi:hypothetical protein
MVDHPCPRSLRLLSGANAPANHAFSSIAKERCISPSTTATSQRDSVCLDGAHKTATDSQFLCGDGAFHLGAVRDPDNGSVKLAFDAI